MLLFERCLLCKKSSSGILTQKSVKTYFSILKTNFLVYLHYPLELLMVVLQRVVTISLLMVFWNLVLKSAAGSKLQISELLSYFLIADGIGELTMATRTKFGTLLRRSIKSGQISNYLIKPLRILPAMYAHVWGERSIYNAPALACIFLGVCLNPPTNIANYLIFLLFLVLATTIAFAINLFEGVLTFYVTSPGGIMSSLVHIIRILSGALAPLEYFPNELRKVVELTPFPSMIFTPVHSLMRSPSELNIFRNFTLCIIWAVVLNFLTLRLWRRGLRQYEAIGL